MDDDDRDTRFRREIFALVEVARLADDDLLTASRARVRAALVRRGVLSDDAMLRNARSAVGFDAAGLRVTRPRPEG